MLLPHLGFAFEDAVRILCKGTIPSKLDGVFWYEIEKEQLVAEHPHEVVIVLSTILNSTKDLRFEQKIVVQIVKSLQGLEEKERKQLQEALLKHGISVLLY